MRQYRIMKLLAIIGFLVILLPFFTSGKGVPSNPAMINPPPFPNQAAENSLNQPIKNSQPTEKTSLAPDLIMITANESITKPREKPIIVALQKATVNRDLLKLQSATWVIQLASFKNKTHAVHLVDQLRRNGYKAFMQSVSSTFGETTRVCVGPEPKHIAAKVLAERLEKNMHLHGKVVSFKPLAL